MISINSPQYGTLKVSYLIKQTSISFRERIKRHKKVLALQEKETPRKHRSPGLKWNITCRTGVSNWYRLMFRCLPTSNVYIVSNVMEMSDSSVIDSDDDYTKIISDVLYIMKLLPNSLDSRRKDALVHVMEVRRSLQILTINFYLTTFYLLIFFCIILLQEKLEISFVW